MYPAFPVAYRTVFALFVLVSLVLQDALHAQGTGQSGTQSGTALQDMTPEQLALFYLARERVVVAGSGFINAQVDDPLPSVLGIWGEPVSQNQSDYVYRPVPGLTVTFTGNDAVHTITCEGTAAAPFRTGRGARFGMNPQEVASLYRGEKGKKSSNRIDYKGLGITFLFTGDSLDRVVVYDAAD